MNRAERRRQAKTQRRAPPGLGEIQALLQRGRTEDARRLLGQHLKARPEDAAAWQLSGLLALQAGAPSAAVEALETADRLSPGDLGLRTNLAVALGENGDTRDALKRLDAVIAEAPGYAPAQYNRGLLLRRGGDLLSALAALEAALAVEPGYAKAAAEKAHLLQQLGRYGEAMEAYRQSGKEDAETLLELGRCLQESGAEEPALETYRKVLALDPGAYAAVVKAITTASKGFLYLDPAELRRRLSP